MREGLELRALGIELDAKIAQLQSERQSLETICNESQRRALEAGSSTEISRAQQLQKLEDKVKAAKEELAREKKLVREKKRARVASQNNTSRSFVPTDGYTNDAVSAATHSVFQMHNKLKAVLKQFQAAERGLCSPRTASTLSKHLGSSPREQRIIKQMNADKKLSKKDAAKAEASMQSSVAIELRRAEQAQDKSNALLKEKTQLRRKLRDCDSKLEALRAELLRLEACKSPETRSARVEQ
jgi:hypothetical protein